MEMYIQHGNVTIEVYFNSIVELYLKLCLKEYKELNFRGFCLNSHVSQS
jgi:hypothetical protein